MKRKDKVERNVVELLLKDTDILEITTAIEGPLGYENAIEYRISVTRHGRLNIEKMTPGGWRSLRRNNEM
ncbi:MAG: hypothetical protein ACP5D6_11085 [Kosmotogaceae bacterium]